MKRNTLFIFLFVPTIFVGIAWQTSAQSPAYLWAKSAGGTSSDWGNSVSTDAAGNVFVTGSFYSPAITFGTTTLTNADNTGNSYDMFIVKYDPGGNVLWAKRAGGTSDDAVYSCITDASGNIIATGYFGSSSITFGSTTLTNAGTYDVFIVKYDSNGNVLWAQGAGGTSYDEGYSCSTDANGNITATGYFASSITFGTTTLTSPGDPDVFIVKYDSSGSVLWAKSVGGTDIDVGWSCSTDANDNIIVIGYFWSSSITFGTTTLINASSFYDMFIVKYDSNGNVLWAQRAGGTFEDRGNSCSIDANGNVIVTGFFNSSFISFGTTILTNAGLEDIFIVKYDPSGNVLWAKKQDAGGTSYDYGLSCSTDLSGNIIVTGYFRSDSITFGTTTLTNAGNGDIFIVKYAPNGTVLWAKSAGGTYDDGGYSCSTDGSGNIIATGYFLSSSITFGSFTLTNAGSDDMFIAKLDSVLTGIESPLTTENEISIFPNPTGGKFVVQITNQYRFTDYELEIYNVFGEKVYSMDDGRWMMANGNTSTVNHSAFQDGIRLSADQPLTIDLSEAPSGIYFIKIISAQGTVNKKVVIAR